MLYQFPTPEWFDAGTTSHSALIVSLWAMIFGIPASVLGCWILGPRSRIIWCLAVSFWILASLLLILSCSQSIPPSLLRDVPEYLAIAAFVVLLLFPFPACLEGINELLKMAPPYEGLPKIPTWSCSIGFGALILFLILPKISDERNSTPRTLCKNNLKQIGLALHNFHDRHGRFPDSVVQTEDLPARSWRVELLPFLDQSREFNIYDKKSVWDSATNIPLSHRELRSYTCPAVPHLASQDSSGRWYSAYATLTGPQTAFPGGRGLSLEEFSDGTSNTALVVEACGQQIVWTEPRDIEISARNVGINLPGNQPDRSPAAWSSYHGRGTGGGANSLQADGSVRFLSGDTDLRVLLAISTANGGEAKVAD